MMSPSLQPAFEAWIKRETWHTGHTFDDQLFFKFVWAAVQQGSSKPSGGDIEENILHNWTGRLNHDYLHDKARQYASLYSTLCEFADERPSAN